ncbi:MAG: class I SAM-dependent methyltransferase [Victivallales bacterium]|jgi:ubiquinone/menaquinone biosynthesis C-methylase UbiE|nr:class I SAM-dependent methyltransferase [Victivallales bacterium]
MRKDVIENFKKYQDRLALYRTFGYDMDQERAFIIEKSMPFSGNILEAGTGKGYFTLALARAGYKFFSLDISAAEQRFALLNLMYQGLQQQVTFFVANVESIPCDDGFFDVIFAVNMIHHLSSVRKVCDEIIRILVPGGKIVLSDFNKKGLAILDKIHKSEGRRHEVSGGTLADVKIILAERGFTMKEYQSELQDILVAGRMTT